MEIFTEVRVRELRIADVIRLYPHDKFYDAVVTQITDTEVKLFRPYVVTADFSYTEGVIPYIGIEQFSIPRNDSTVVLLERKELR